MPSNNEWGSTDPLGLIECTEMILLVTNQIFELKARPFLGDEGLQLPYQTLYKAIKVHPKRPNPIDKSIFDQVWAGLPVWFPRVIVASDLDVVCEVEAYITLCKDTTDSQLVLNVFDQWAREVLRGKYAGELATTQYLAVIQELKKIWVKKRIFSDIFLSACY